MVVVKGLTLQIMGKAGCGGGGRGGGGGQAHFAVAVAAALLAWQICGVEGRKTCRRRWLESLLAPEEAAIGVRRRGSLL